jgi:hypothetical protein
MMAGQPVEDEEAADARRDKGLVSLMKMKPKRHDAMKLGKPRNRVTSKGLPPAPDKKPGK